MTSEVGSEVVGEAVEDRRGRVGQKEKKCIIFAAAQSVRWPVRRTGKSTRCATGAPHRKVSLERNRCAAPDFAGAPMLWKNLSRPDGMKWWKKCILKPRKVINLEIRKVLCTLLQIIIAWTSWIIWRVCLQCVTWILRMLFMDRICQDQDYPSPFPYLAMHVKTIKWR